MNALATTDAVRPAVEATWSIGTSLMIQAATATVIYGVVILFATWFAGPTRWARAARRDLAPYLREPRWAWGVFGVVVLGLLAWAPTPAFREVIPALALIGLLALGLEALRRQTAREYPDARREDSFRRVRGWVRGLGARIRGREDDSRLEQLERLGRLRDSGVLDSAEYEQEKGRLLAERAAV